MRDDDGVVVPGGDARHRLLAVAGFEVFLAGDEKAGLRVELQELRTPLVHQVVRHDKHGLLRQVKAAKLHRGGGHGPGLTRTHDMSQQWAAALEDAPNCVFLMSGEVSIAKGGPHHSG